MFQCVLRLPTVVHRAFPFFDAKAWQQSQTDLFMCTTVLHCGHTFPNESMRLSMESLHPWFFQQLVEWVVRLQRSTRDWQMEFPRRSKNYTRLSWDGSVAVYHLQSSAPPSYVFVEADFLTTVQSMN